MYTTIKTLWERHKNKSMIARLTGHDWKNASAYGSWEKELLGESFSLGWAINSSNVLNYPNLPDAGNLTTSISDILPYRVCKKRLCPIWR